VILELAWIAAALSGIAAVLAALALLKSRTSDPALASEMGRLSTGVNLLQSLLTDSASSLRTEIVKVVTTLGDTTAGSVQRLGQAQSEMLGNTVQRVQSLSEATERHLIGVKKDATESGRALREEVNGQLQASLATIRDTLQQSGTTQHS
jgi:hypothetical protein